MLAEESTYTRTKIDFTSDISETRQSYLNLALILAVFIFGSIPLILDVSRGAKFWLMVPLLVGSFITYILNSMKHPLLASWTILISLQALPIVWLYRYNAGTEQAYYLALIPIIISGLLLDTRQQIVFTILSETVLIILALLGTSQPSANVLLIVTVIAITTLVTREAHGSAFRELTSWALEAQTKSEQRSKMYYEQREQLQEALHKLTIANFQLEEMNLKLNQAYHQAEQANTVKSMFLAAMSHELRTPLNSILNFSQFMIKGMMGPTTEKQQESLGYIHTSGQHLLSLINDVLDISKIEAGALELFVEDDVDVVEELRTILKTGESLLANKPVEIHIEAEDNLPLIVGDRQRIFQIVMNLVSNACKFTQEGTIKLKALRKNGSLIVAVEDSGPGIALEEQTAVFETFRQTKRGFAAGGTGLGLPISKRLAEAHGGQLWLESEPGHGATFFVELPVRSQDLLALMHERTD